VFNTIRAHKTTVSYCKFPSAKFLSLIFIFKNRINVIDNLNAGFLLATCKTFSLHYSTFSLVNASTFKLMKTTLL